MCNGLRMTEDRHQTSTISTAPASADPIGKPAGDKERIIGNFLSLTVLQFANYVVPLLTLPYLTRVLGRSRYGLTEFAQALAVYFVIVTDYGFYLSATQEISLHREDPQKLSEIFSAVMVLKLCMLVLSFFVLAAVVLGVPKLRPDWPIYFMAFGTVLGQCLFPVWLFQGLERMKHIAVLNITAKMLVMASIFIFIRRSDDYVYVPLINSSGAVFVGCAGLLVALRYFPVRFRLPTIRALRSQLAGGWHLFVSKAATTLYTTCNTIILGLAADPAYVASYVGGDRIVRAVQCLQQPLSQAVFPHIGRLASQSRKTAAAFAGRLARIVAVVMLLLSVGLFVTAPYLGRLVLGPQFGSSTIVIRILSFLPLIIGLSNVFGIQVMVNFGMKRTMTKVLAAAGFLNVALALILVVHWRHVGISVAVLVTEIFVTTVMYVILRRRGLDVLRIRATANHGL
jgi:PST family polysaccharide transporter